MTGASNLATMATTHAQVTAAHDVHASTVAQEVPAPSSPTLTNPDSILPEEAPFSALTPTISSDSISRSSHDGRSSPKSHKRSDSEGTTELLTATAVVMPQRFSVQPTTIKASAAATAATAAAYTGYEHGTPLSDIGEEDSDSDSTTRDDKSRTPSPNPDGTIAIKKPRLRHKKRLSNLSSSSGGSDVGTWEDFDTSKLGSDRVAADIAHARESAENDDTKSRRDSKEIDEELALLNERAEKILASARKRLTHMEDNLSKARHSIVLTPSRSTPNMHEVAQAQGQSQIQNQTQSHQPAGSLYRSISQNAHRKSRGGFPVKPNSTLSHARTGSDDVVPSGMKRLSRIPEVRSASALDYSRPRFGVVTPEGKVHPQSPSSSRSFNSPLRILTEEDADSPSTTKTSPDSTMHTFTAYRGLGIHSSGSKGQEDISQLHYESSSTPTSLDRSNSQASTRSARELTEKMSEMKNRIAELKSKAQADSMKRQSISSLRGDSPFNGSSTISSATQYQPSSPEIQDRASSSSVQEVSTVAEPRGYSRLGHQRKDSALDDDEPAQNPVTPVTARFLNNDTTPIPFESARTDRNTVNLTKRRARPDSQPDDVDLESIIQSSVYVDAEQDVRSEDEEDEVAVNEEEQIYLNEVLEESLQDLEPVVPSIPGEYLIDEIAGEEGLSHEDRLDAFDYENMFLHSAMGTYTGKRESDEESDNESIETSRQDMQTPTLVDDNNEDGGEMSDEQNDGIQDDNDSCGNDDDEVDTDEEMEAVMLSQHQPSRQPPLRNPLRDQVHHVDKLHLQEPRKPWMSLGRSNSVESNASTATFQTATEGLGTPEEELPEEILNWGNAPSQGQAIYIQPRSPIRAVQIHSPPRRHVSNNGSISEMTNGRTQSRTPSDSLLKNVVTGNLSPTSPRPRSASGQYRIFPSSIPISPTGQRAKLAEHGRDTSIISTQTVAPQTSTTSPHDQPQASSPLLGPPISPQSPQSPSFKTTHPHFHRHTRSTSSQISTSSNGSVPQPQPVKANTTILMESLIKLADPNFTMGPNTHFEDLDKDLVLALLRAVGGVSEEMLRAQAYGDGDVVRELRRRLGKATGILVSGGSREED